MKLYYTMAEKVKISDSVTSNDSNIAASSKAVKMAYDKAVQSSSAVTMPINSVYVQYAGQSAPNTIFGGTWSNISSSFAGLFFRAEGGASASYGGSQTGGLPNITGNLANASKFVFTGNSVGAFMESNAPNSYGIGIGNNSESWKLFSFSAKNSNNIYGNASEVRPVNSTIRIWKRVS